MVQNAPLDVLRIKFAGTKQESERHDDHAGNDDGRDEYTDYVQRAVWRIVAACRGGGEVMNDLKG